MINAINDIKHSLRFRKESVSAIFAQQKQKQQQQRRSFGKDSLQLADDVKALSRFGLSWGESDVKADEAGFAFTLVVTDMKGQRATIAARHNYEAPTAELSWWIETLADEYHKKMAIGLENTEPVGVIEWSEKEHFTIEELAHARVENLNLMVNQLLEAAWLLWKVTLSSDPAFAIRAVHTPFQSYRAAYVIVNA